PGVVGGLADQHRDLDLVGGEERCRRLDLLSLPPRRSSDLVAAPCVVLLDLWVPVMAGWQVLEEMRADVRLRDVPVLVVTAAGEGPRHTGAREPRNKPIP